MKRTFSYTLTVDEVCILCDLLNDELHRASQMSGISPAILGEYQLTLMELGDKLDKVPNEAA